MTREEAQELIEEIKREDTLTDASYQYCITAEGFIDFIYEHGFIVVTESEFYGDHEDDNYEDDFIGSKKPPISPD